MTIDSQRLWASWIRHLCNIVFKTRKIPTVKQSPDSTSPNHLGCLRWWSVSPGGCFSVNQSVSLGFTRRDHHASPFRLVACGRVPPPITRVLPCLERDRWPVRKGHNVGRTWSQQSYFYGHHYFRWYCYFVTLHIAHDKLKFSNLKSFSDLGSKHIPFTLYRVSFLHQILSFSSVSHLSKVQKNCVTFLEIRRSF